MPLMDSLQMTRALRRQNIHTPVLFPAFDDCCVAESGALCQPRLRQIQKQKETNDDPPISFRPEVYPDLVHTSPASTKIPQAKPTFRYRAFLVAPLGDVARVDRPLACETLLLD